MRSLAILMVLFAAGCGAGRGAAATPKATGSERGAAVVALVQRAALAVCRCADGMCADAAVQRLGLALRGRDDVMLTTSEHSAMVHAVARLDTCRARLVSRGEQAARVAERWALETCACPSADCMAVASRRGADELKRYADAEGNDDELRRIIDASRRVRSCLRSAGLTGQR